MPSYTNRYSDSPTLSLKFSCGPSRWTRYLGKPLCRPGQLQRLVRRPSRVRDSGLGAAGVEEATSVRGADRADPKDFQSLAVIQPAAHGTAGDGHADEFPVQGSATANLPPTVGRLCRWYLAPNLLASRRRRGTASNLCQYRARPSVTAQPVTLVRDSSSDGGSFTVGCSPTGTGSGG